MPHSTRAIATRTGALPRPATQCTAMQGPSFWLFWSLIWPFCAAAAVGEEFPEDVPPPVAVGLNRSMIRLSQSVMICCGGGVPEERQNAENQSETFSISNKFFEHQEEQHTIIKGPIMALNAGLFETFRAIGWLTHPDYIGNLAALQLLNVLRKGRVGRLVSDQEPQIPVRQQRYVVHRVIDWQRTFLWWSFSHRQRREGGKVFKCREEEEESSDEIERDEEETAAAERIFTQRPKRQCVFVFGNVNWCDVIGRVQKEKFQVQVEFNRVKRIEGSEAIRQKERRQKKEKISILFRTKQKFRFIKSSTSHRHKHTQRHNGDAPKNTRENSSQTKTNSILVWLRLQ